MRLSTFAGATLRGGFGHVFKRAVCTRPPGECPRCLLKNTCAYPYVFETAPPPGSEKLRGLDQVPRLYVIEAPGGPAAGRSQTYGPGERFDFRLVLVGRAVDHLPYFLSATSGTMTVFGDYTQPGGTAAIADSTLTAAIYTIAPAAGLATPVLNYGNVSVADTLTVAGNYSQGSSGRLVIEVPQDAFQVNGLASLGGTLEVN